MPPNNGAAHEDPTLGSAEADGTDMFSLQEKEDQMQYLSSLCSLLHLGFAVLCTLCVCACLCESFVRACVKALCAVEAVCVF